MHLDCYAMGTGIDSSREPKVRRASQSGLNANLGFRVNLGRWGQEASASTPVILGHAFLLRRTRLALLLQVRLSVKSKPQSLPLLQEASPAPPSLAPHRLPLSNHIALNPWLPFPALTTPQAPA